MLYVDIPTKKQIQTLNETRADACISIYLPTTPVTQDIDQSRILFGNLTRRAVSQLEDNGLDKRRLAKFHEMFDDLAEDDEFWRVQANSLAVLATPDRIQTYRLANGLSETVEVSGRFHLKPLLRAVTFPHAAYVLALSENSVRLVEVSADLPATEVSVPDLPKDAASATGKSTINDRSHSRRIHGSEGQKVQLTKFIRQIEHALRPFLAKSDLPLILAASEPLASLFPNVSSIDLLPGAISRTTDRSTPAELAAEARKVLDTHYAGELDRYRETFEARSGDGRTTTDISDAARAATFGAVETLLVDIDAVVHGTVDDDSGAVTFSETPDANNYGVVDEIAARALISGARVLGVRKQDLPEGQHLSAVLRYSI